ncbi:MAG TPA: hypothetical protein VGE01_14915 [Fimbriimonas sp.]
MLKNTKSVIDIETEASWRIERRTRGADIVTGPNAKPTQTWVLILTNKEGHRRFVPEARIWEQYKPVEH